MQGFIYKNITNKKQFLAMKVLQNKIFGVRNVLTVIQALRAFQKKRFNVAMFIDADNVTPGLVRFAIEKVSQEYGKISIKNIYGNWSNKALLDIWNPSIKQYRLTRVDNYSQSKGKNSTDICVTIGAMDILHQKKDIDIFVLISSDSDFINLVHRLKDERKLVIGYGHDPNINTQKAYDEYYIVDRAKPQTIISPPKETIHRITLEKSPKQVLQSEQKTKEAVPIEHQSEEKKEEKAESPLPQKQSSEKSTKPTEKKSEEGLGSSELMREKFISDLVTAYNCVSANSNLVSMKSLYEQYKKIDKVITFLYYNKFVEKVKNTGYFEVIPDPTTGEIHLKLKSPSVSWRIFPISHFPWQIHITWYHY